MRVYSLLTLCGCAVAGLLVLRGINGDPVILHQPAPANEEGICGNVAIDRDYYDPSPGKPDGKALFQQHCAPCHHPLKDAVGAALAGADKRAPSKKWLYNWVRNPGKLLAAKDAYATEIFKQWGSTMMPAFPKLTDEEIDAIFSYANAQGATLLSVD